MGLSQRLERSHNSDLLVKPQLFPDHPSSSSSQRPTPVEVSCADLYKMSYVNKSVELTQADLIVSELGTADAVISAARGLVAAEQNFNPFVVSIPSVCSDPTLPTTAALRGVVPLIDPAVGGEALENANSATSKSTPFDATGLSVAQVMVAHGFSNFTAEAVDGIKVSAADLGTASSAAGASVGSVSASSAAIVATSAANIASSSSSAIGCVSTTLVTVTRAVSLLLQPSRTLFDKKQTASTSVPAAVAASSSSASVSVASTASAGACTGSGSTLLCTSPSVGSGAVTNAVTGNFDGFVASTISGLDFGLCVPTIKFEAGLDGRASTEFTFQAIDPLVNKGQEEALNPNIITNRIHDQLTNVCGANQAAKDATAAAQTQIAALGTRDVTTANAWNTALGFAGTNTNPDNAPLTGLVGHT